MIFGIRKSTRDTITPYRGPACTDAGVEPGRLYPTREEALIDAAKLGQTNPVGFVVFELPSPEA